MLVTLWAAHVRSQPRLDHDSIVALGAAVALVNTDDRPAGVDSMATVDELARWLDDQRISGQSNPSESELNGRHMQRFKMICNAAKSMNVSIWVIAFGTTLTTEMRDCASNANQASTISNRDQLIARFRQIGSNIGALRLTQ